MHFLHPPVRLRLKILQSRHFFAASLAILAAWSLAPSPARADIYTYRDANGVLHISNIRSNPRYKLYMRTPAARPQLASAAPGAHPAALALPSAARRARYAQMIQDASLTYQLDPALLHAVISAESGYNPNAVSPKGAVGLMQLMPATARRYGVVNVFDPWQNIQAGARYLKDLLLMFNNDTRLAVAAYNAGEGAVLKYGYHIPPYLETVNYVPKVMRFYERYRTKMANKLM